MLGRIALWIGLGMMTTTLARAQVSIQKIDYQGWTGAYRLANKLVEVVYVPQIGRVMRYGYIGDVNLLWENPEHLGKTTPLTPSPVDWINYGGDKLWPAPQKVWGWPPDPVMDSGIQKATITPDKKLRIEGRISPKHNLSFVRTISLEAQGTSVTFENTLVNHDKKPAQWAVWQVTQVNSPDRLRMPLYAKGSFKKGYYVFQGSEPVKERMQVLTDELQIVRDSAKSAKIGGDSPLGWIAAEKGAIRFEVSAKRIAGKPYPDDGCSLEIYTNPDPLPYVELELLSPLATIKPGQTLSLTTKWSLKRVR